MDYIEEEILKLERVYIQILHQHNLVSNENRLNRALQGLQQLRSNGVKKELSEYLIEREVITLDHHEIVAKRLREYVQCEQEETKAVNADTGTSYPPQSEPESKIAPRKPEKKYKSFGPYRILEKVASGAMGVIYKAEDTRNGEVIALKMLRAGAEARKKQVQRFEREARSAAKVNDPGVVSILDDGEIQGIPYIAMDFVEGCTLDEYWEKIPQDAEEAVRIGAAIARALGHIHQVGIIHRDIKPANILMDTTTTPAIPKITDFSLAMLTDPLEKRLTQTGATVGTPYYMSPEQTLGQREEIGPHSDMYSLGAVLYEMLAGAPPFKAKSLRELYAKIQKRRPLSLRKHNREVPRVLERVIFKSLEKMPAFRYKNCGEFAEVLEKYLRGENLQLEKAGLWPRLVSFFHIYRSRLIRIASFSGALLLLFFLLISYFGQSDERKKARAMAFMEKGIEYRQKGDFNKAIESFIVAINNDPTFSDARKQLDLTRRLRSATMVDKAKNLAKNGEYERALEEIRKAANTAKYPLYVEDTLWFANEALQNNDRENFWRWAVTWQRLPVENHLIAIHHSHAEDYLLKALSLFYAGYPKRAGFELFQSKKDEVVAQLLQGQLFWLTGKRQDGKKILSGLNGHLFENDPPCPLLLIAKGEYAAAYKYNQQFLQWDDSRYQYWMTSGILSFEVGLYDHAASFFNKIPESSGYYYASRYYFGECLLEQGKYPRAKEVFESIIQQEKGEEKRTESFSDVCYHLAYIYAELKNREKCMEYSDRALERFSPLELATLYHQIGLSTNSMQMLRAPLQQNLPDAYYLLGLIRKRSPSKSFSDFANAARLDPFHYKAFLKMGQVKTRKNPQEAIIYYEQAFWCAPWEIRSEIFSQWMRLCFANRQYWRLGIVRSVFEQPLPAEFEQLWQDLCVVASRELEQASTPWLKLQRSAIAYYMGKPATWKNVRTHPDQDQAKMHLLLALLHYLEDDYQQALLYLSPSLENSPDPLFENFLKGQILLQINELERAQKQFKSVVQMDRTYQYRLSYFICMNTLAKKYHSIYNFPKKSAQTLEALLDLHPRLGLSQRSRAYIDLAEAYKDWKKEDPEIKVDIDGCYRKAIQQTPGNYYPYLRAGEYYYPDDIDHKRMRKALDFYQFSLFLAKHKENREITSFLQDKIDDLKKRLEE